MSILKDTIDKTKKKATKLIDNAVETAKKKAEEGKRRREEKERQFKESFPYKYMLVINRKQDLESKSKNLWMTVRDGAFVISDSKSKPLYIAQEGFWVNDYKYKVYNQNKELIGSVRKHMVNFGFPFVKDRHGCTVKVATPKKSFRFTTYLSFGDRNFGGTGTITESRPFELKGVGESKYPIEFKIKKGRKNIIHIYNIASNNGFLYDRFIVGFDDERDEILAVLCGLAVRLIGDFSHIYP